MEEIVGVQHHAEVGQVPDILLRGGRFLVERSQWICWLGETEEVFPVGDGVRPGIAALELDVVREPLLRRKYEGVVSRRAVAEVGPNRAERWIRPVVSSRRCKIKEPWMIRIGHWRGEVLVGSPNKPCPNTPWYPMLYTNVDPTCRWNTSEA